MTRSLESRIERLEAPARRGACVACELAQLNGNVEDGPCRHTDEDRDMPLQINRLDDYLKNRREGETYDAYRDRAASAR